MARSNKSIFCGILSKISDNTKIKTHLNLCPLKIKTKVETIKALKGKATRGIVKK